MLVTPRNPQAQTAVRRPVATAPAKIDKAEFAKTVQSAIKHGLVKPPSAEVPLDLSTLKPVTVPGVTSGFYTVTPEQARAWIRRNTNNRNLDNALVQSLVRDIRTGRWTVTHQGIAFNDRGELLDGQHRLEAIIRAGDPVVVMVTAGLKSKPDSAGVVTMDAIDRGRPRSIADQLKLQHGIKHSRLVAGIAAGIAGLCCGARIRRLSVAQTLAIYREFEPAVLWVIQNRSTTKGLRAFGNVAAFTFAIMADTEEGDVIKAMFKTLNEGKNLKDWSAISALRKFLLSDEARLMACNAEWGIAPIVLNAILLAIDKKQVKRIDPGEAGLKNYVALQPERVKRIADLLRLQ